MIGQSVRLITIRSIKVGLHSSWFILFFLITSSLITRVVSEHRPWTPVGQYGVAIVTTPPFFVSILLHTVAHSLVVQP